MSKNKILCVIPARYGSTRLKAKPLIPIQGKPLVMWAYESAVRAGVFDTVCVATDHKEIFNTVQKQNGLAVMTSPLHERGTDRVFEAARQFKHNYIVNLQGDEPNIPASVLKDFCKALTAQIDDNSLLTCVSNATIEDIGNPNTVKVVLNRRGEALYFSRSPIPYDCTRKRTMFYRHAGIYGFTKGSLKRFCSFAPSELEQCEKLEQLRALENGMTIRCLLRDYQAVGIDTAVDLDKFRSTIKKYGRTRKRKNHAADR
jgi:3-deoxy-manno-octulosonate cytidylyltransferase (CMP-KDO synthetase)